MINSYIGKKVLITTSNWFYAPDGITYRAIFGRISNAQFDESKKIVWLELGNIIISGSEILNLIATESVNYKDAADYIVDEGEANRYKRPSHIYMASVDIKSDC